MTACSMKERGEKGHARYTGYTYQEIICPRQLFEKQIFLCPRDLLATRMQQSAIQVDPGKRDNGGELSRREAKEGSLEI